jgi:DNA helicase HerA-like ATPase
MSRIDQFKEELTVGYSFKGDHITLGGAKFDGEGVPGIHVKIPLKTLNRHGLIAGATGTGKTKTLQVIAEQLSEKGIPSVLMDIKGDLSGLAAPGTLNDFIDKRHKAMNLPYEPKAMPVELLTLTEGKGTRLKATVTEFGPVLLSKILGLNNTQASVISLVFMYCDNNKLPLIDLKDLRKTLQFLMDDGKAEMEKEYGTISASTVGIIMRKVIEIEQQGAQQFFGERSFDPQDLLRVDKNGNGIISIIRLMDIQNKPKLFSTFMLSLMAEIYNTFPEEGDSDKPKLCIFIDEAHLVFDEASDALMDQLEVIIKLIRSKGVGIFFCTQNPIDVPDSILSQLGLKVQHALRAFTEKDRTAIKKAAQNYPITEFYKTDEIITQMGTGEALVSALNEKGVPTPLAVTICRAPLTRMNVLEDSEVDELVKNSDIAEKYNEEIDRESAYEILSGKIEKAASIEQQEKKNLDQYKELVELQKTEEKRFATRQKEIDRLRKMQAREEKAKTTEYEKLWKDITRGATRKTKDTSLFGILARGILGVLGVK